MKNLIAAVLAGILLAPIAVCAQEKPAPGVGLHTAALQGDVQAIRQHIDAGSDLNQKDAYGSSPLMIAVVFGRTDVALALIEAGADLEIRNNYGATPLHSAALLCHTKIVDALLDNGANRFLRDNFSNTPSDAVAAPFEDVKIFYDNLAKGLGPLGLQLDYDYIKATRPKIVQMLRPGTEDLQAVDYAPQPGAGDDWKVSTPAEQGLNPDLVAELYLDAAHMPKLYSLLIIKNDHLIAEGYFNGATAEQKARIQSVTKSYTSALTGIALDRGYLSSVDQKFLDFYPEVAEKVMDPRKKQITIQHLLQMRSGYPWEESDPAYWNRMLTGQYVDDVEIIPLLGDPGTQFNYSNLSSNWLGILVSRSCGTDLKSFAQEHLFAPIDAEPGDWGTDAHGNNNGCGDLHMSARDMAKFGSLYLNEGRFQGKQIIPADWVGASLEDYSSDAWVTKDKARRIGPYFRELGYGYQFWSATTGDRRFDYAAGHGGQLIVLLDDLDMMVVVTAYPFYLQHDEKAWMHEKTVYNLVGKFILSLPTE